ncbi:MAG: hypothetical protein M1511_13085 [Deltaproteobacteria bacterium]|nr:hypothetical protein [Deltaproteobacteria bacterium]
MVSRKVEEMVLGGQGLSVIIDRRFTNNRDIDNICSNAIADGKKVKIFDIDTPLGLSAVRVLGRDHNGVSPCVPFYVLSNGFELIKLNRKKLIGLVNSAENVELYILFEGSDGLDEVGRKKAGSQWKYKHGKDKFDKLVYISRELVLREIKEVRRQFEKRINEHSRDT